ncbi:hypothetical protein D9613_010739 [Agrocybe pediades]|uniref:Uncharacterized protein n=1 Tax=Agrocybe pediades TaxID=84607 RepID=A0A8H4QLQ7_9AGAR|nr:hypothetical protein D9613_010739 [Agrocybe pediades]
MNIENNEQHHQHQQQGTRSCTCDSNEQRTTKAKKERGGRGGEVKTSRQFGEAWLAIHNEADASHPPGKHHKQQQNQSIHGIAEYTKPTKPTNFDAAACTIICPELARSNAHFSFSSSSSSNSILYSVATVYPLPSRLIVSWNMDQNADHVKLEEDVKVG